MIQTSPDVYSAYVTLKGQVKKQSKIIEALNDKIEMLKKAHALEVNNLKKEMRRLRIENSNEFDDGDVFTRVGIYIKVDSSEFTGKCRKREFVIGRQLIQYYFYNEQMMTLKQVGKVFNSHHATIIHNIKQAEHYINNPKIYPYESKIYKEAILLE